jgi:hypothetical protein
MKRLLVLGACCMLGMAASARAELYSVTPVVTDGGITLSATWDFTDADYDVVKIYFKSLNGTHTAVTSIKARWDAIGGQFLVPTGAGGAYGGVFGPHTTERKMSVNSAMNFDGVAGPFFRQPGTDDTTLSSYIDGTWFTADVPSRLTTAATDTDDDTYGENLLATFYVTKSCYGITFGDRLEGIAGDRISAIGYSTFPTTVTTHFSIGGILIPEPSTLALLGCSVFGLLAYAWRKRK